MVSPASGTPVSENTRGFSRFVGLLLLNAALMLLWVPYSLGGSRAVQEKLLPSAEAGDETASAEAWDFKEPRPAWVRDVPEVEAPAGLWQARATATGWLQDSDQSDDDDAIAGSTSPFHLHESRDGTEPHQRALPEYVRKAPPGPHAPLRTLPKPTLSARQASRRPWHNLGASRGIPDSEQQGLGSSFTEGQSHSSSSVSKEGVRVHFDLLTAGAWWYHQEYARWEPATFRVFKRFVPNQVVLDIGAWIGPTVLWEAHLARRVVALEPTPKAYSQLVANLASNPPDVADRVTLIQAALHVSDEQVQVSNRGDSTDRVSPRRLEYVRALTIETLRQEHPELEEVSFVKIDTEGHEELIIPALRAFFEEKRPVAFISLHPMYIGNSRVQKVVDVLKAIFPFLYMEDMVTPFDTTHGDYTRGEHGGSDVLCTWTSLT